MRHPHTTSLGHCPPHGRGGQGQGVGPQVDRGVVWLLHGAEAQHPRARLSSEPCLSPRTPDIYAATGAVLRAGGGRQPVFHPQRTLPVQWPTPDWTTRWDGEETVVAILPADGQRVRTDLARPRRPAVPKPACRSVRRSPWRPPGCCGRPGLPLYPSATPGRLGWPYAGHVAGGQSGAVCDAADAPSGDPAVHPPGRPPGPGGSGRSWSASSRGSASASVSGGPGPCSLDLPRLTRPAGRHPRRHRPGSCRSRTSGPTSSFPRCRARAERDPRHGRQRTAGPLDLGVGGSGGGME